MCASGMCSRSTGRKPAPCLKRCCKSIRTRASSILAIRGFFKFRPFDAMGTPFQLIKQFGTRADFMFAVNELQSAIYQRAS